jgi:prepilin-type N-terminal cleavage/methylation domain-containing protein
MINKISSLKYKKGMTLIELLVVLAIFAIISSIVIFNYGSSRSAVSVQNLADDIALSVRKTQSYAIGVKKIYSSADPSNSVRSFGITFSTDPFVDSKPGLPNYKRFNIFADLPVGSSDGSYEQSDFGNCGLNTLSPSSECLESLFINSDAHIDNISYSNMSVADKSTPSASIIFTRPSPNATICIPNSSNVCDPDHPSHIDIMVSSGTGDSKISKVITVWNTGQISVK